MSSESSGVAFNVATLLISTSDNVKLNLCTNPNFFSIFCPCVSSELGIMKYFEVSLQFDSILRVPLPICMSNVLVYDGQFMISSNA